MVADLAQGGARVMAAMGGIGGRGNAFFKSSTHQAPRFAQPGMPGDEKVLSLNLKLIADVGLVGLPNSGKSTLLSKITNAKPKIAAYPFTTLIPNLGVVQRGDGTSYRIADIPGIVEGAHRGLGLGLSFLQHIVRVRVILYLLDVAGEDPRYSLELLKSELGTYSGELLEKPYCVLLTKADLADEKGIQKVIDQIDDRPILPVSSLSGFNLKRLERLLDGFLE